MKKKESVTSVTSVTSVKPMTPEKEEPVKEAAPPTTETVETAEPPATKNALEVFKRQLPELADKLQDLITRMDPNKPGFEEMGGAGWSIPIIRLRQAMSNNAPANSKNGDLYTDTGVVLSAPWKFIPLYMHYGHAKFEPNNSSPTCRSEDAKVSIYGDICAQCNDRPFKDDQKTLCQKSINVYCFDEKFENLYRLQFSKTSYRAGTRLFHQASSDKHPWDRVYALASEVKSREGDGAKYWVFTVAPVGTEVDDKYKQLAAFIYEKIAEMRKKIKEAAATRTTAGKQVMAALPDDYGETSAGGAGKGTPTDM